MMKCPRLVRTPLHMLYTVEMTVYSIRTSEVRACGHRCFRSSEIHRLKALLVSFPTHYRSFWSREVLIASVEEVWVCVDTRRQSHRSRIGTIVVWKADEQSFQTVYLRASEMTVAPCGAAMHSCTIYSTSIWSPTSSPHRTTPSKP